MFLRSLSTSFENRARASQKISQRYRLLQLQVLRTLLLGPSCSLARNNTRCCSPSCRCCPCQISSSSSCNTLQQQKRSAIKLQRTNASSLSLCGLSTLRRCRNSPWNFEWCSSRPHIRNLQLLERAVPRRDGSRSALTCESAANWHLEFRKYEPYLRCPPALQRTLWVCDHCHQDAAATCPERGSAFPPPHHHVFSFHTWCQNLFGTGHVCIATALVFL